MKKLTLTLTGLIAVVLLFAGGVFASQWLSFMGDDQAAESHNDVDRILEILKQENSGKISAETALKELQDLNPAGLAKQNKELREQIEQLKTDNGVLSTDLASKQKEIDEKQREIENKQNEINEKNTAYDLLQQERDQLQSTIDDLNNQIATLNQNNQGNAEYIAHLEAELQRANETMQGLNNKTGAALEEAEAIVGGDK